MDDAIALRLATASRRSGVPVRELREACTSGELSHVVIGEYVVILPADLRAWLESRRVRGRATGIQAYPVR